MKIDIRQEPISRLADYAKIPIAFEVDRVFDVVDDPRAAGGHRLIERAIERPYVKDYDAIPDNRPKDWPRHFDLSNWILLFARVEEKHVGGALLGFNTPVISLFDNRDDIGVLWDIRVAPEARGKGIGGALFREVERRARAHRCRELRIETQNINVPACRFYEQHGCELIAVDRNAYLTFAHEIQLIWSKHLYPTPA
jgi:ribosomal protein S18 acetylase RimI-like enzyme